MAIDREKIHVTAQKYVEKKKYDKAVLEYQKVIQEDPNDARTLLKIGDLQSKMDEYAGAVATYERVGRFYAAQGFSLKAIAVYKQIREIITRHVPHLEEKYAHIGPKLAELYQQLGLTSDALAAFDEVATRFQRQGKDQEAVDVFRKIVELDATNPLPHLRLAEALSKIKDTDGAVSEFAIAAGQLAKLGRRDDALKVIERLLHHRPDPAHARVAAELYLGRNAANDGLQALAKLQICFQANPRDLDTLSLLSRAFNHIGQAAKAIEVQKEMARIARDTGRLELFEEIVHRLIDLVPNDESVRRLASGGSEAPGPASEASRRPASTTAVEAAYEAEAEELDDAAYEDIDEVDEVSEGAGAPDEQNAGPITETDEGTETTVDVIEPHRAPAPEVSALVARAVADAEAFRRARLPSKAVATLRAALRDAPRSLELRQALRDVFVEWGRPQDALDEMMELAGLHVDALDIEAAAQTLQEVLAIEPTHEGAIGMLRELGYEVIEEPAAADGAATEDHVVTATERYAIEPDFARAPGGPNGVEGSLPSYELDEAEPEPAYAAAQEEDELAPPEPSLAEIDDPFAEPPLPSFPLEAGTGQGPIIDEDVDLGGESAARGPRPGAELESALEEAEFFASRGLFDDARAILDEQLQRLPNHPLLLERLAELDEQAPVVQGESGTRPSPHAGAVEDRAFDIAESLNDVEGGDRPSGVGSGPSLGMPNEQVDVEEVFAKFKEGVAKQIDVDDAQSHYDLGLAYKDMGLLEDAIREFETAARDPRHACVCYSMIGMIQLERGHINEAIEAMIAGLSAPERSKDQEAALAYEIGSAYEVKKMNKNALDYFQRAAKVIPGYRDVTERIRRLQKNDPKPASRAVAVGADDEFDRAFEDILGKDP